MKKAFTLAEVLITLGIIGIVAALTLPTLMNNVQDKVLESQRQKAASVLANGYKKMLADNAVFSISDTPLASCEEDECFSVEHKKVFRTILEGFGDVSTVAVSLPDKYIDASGNEIKAPWEEYTYVFVTPDGFIYGLSMDESDLSTSLHVYSDVNGIKNPNTVNKDLIVYNISHLDTVTDITCSVFYCGVTDSSQPCSAANLDACKTADECYSLDSSSLPPGSCLDFRNGKCSISYRCPG